MYVTHNLYRKYEHKELLDVVYVFFLNIQHFKDWVSAFADDALKKEINALQTKDCFVVCADFINNHKHFERAKKACYEDKDSAIYQQHASGTAGLHLTTNIISRQLEHTILEKILDNTPPPEPIYRWTISHIARGDRDAYDLAKECLDEWDTFLKDKKLL